MERKTLIKIQTEVAGDYGWSRIHYDPANIDYWRAKFDSLQLFHDQEMAFMQGEIDRLNKQIESSPIGENVRKRAMWWIANGQVGSSSETMWNCLIGNEKFPVNHPYDPDDFSRCYKLLQIVPEWKKELYKLKPLSSEWNNLIDNWDKLTEMYEQNKKENWANARQVGMYEFMQKILKTQ